MTTLKKDCYSKKWRRFQMLLTDGFDDITEQDAIADVCLQVLDSFFRIDFF